ncbi:MAG: cytidyltransferase, partial [Anaerolineaceae bacterium]|nr:cytidyltransferase [Anaerolineaceae bacterium]
IEFFREAAAYGDLYVALGSDKTIYDLKGKLTINNEVERQFMVKSISYVKEAFISKGSGLLDFETEFRSIEPDYLIVNEDGDLLEKREFCHELGVEYVILKRLPYENLPARSTTALRQQNQIPFRIDLAGGWLDQPWVSKYCPGSVLTISLEPFLDFNERSGMASSTRRAAIDLWGTKIPAGDYEKLSKILFCYDNPPGKKIISGSQDSFGIVFPGLANAFYDGEYWPKRIEHNKDANTLRFIEESLYLVTLGPRHTEYDVLDNTKITKKNACALSQAAENCWNAILNHDIHSFGQSFKASFEAQIAMFPNMMNNNISQLIDQYKDMALGWKLSGAGGGGYLILISDKPIKNAIRIFIRREIE